MNCDDATVDSRVTFLHRTCSHLDASLVNPDPGEAPAARGFNEDAEFIFTCYAEGRLSEGFSRMTDVYRDRIRRLVEQRINRYLGCWPTTHEAEDITHDALVRIHTALARSDDVFSIRNLEAWILRITSSSVYDRLRQAHGRRNSLNAPTRIHDPEMDPAERPVADERQNVFNHVSNRMCLKMFQASLSHLSDRDQRIIALWLEGYRLREIAEMMEMSLPGVAAVKIRSMKKITAGLERQGWRRDASNGTVRRFGPQASQSSTVFP